MPQMWTPPGGDPMVQSVLMDKPEPLTAEQYRAKLAQKFNRMAREMTPEVQEALAEFLADRGAEPAETPDGLMEQLRQTSSLPITLVPQGFFPVKLEQVTPQQMPMPGMMEFRGCLQQMGK